jgi:hypothetical protein
MFVCGELFCFGKFSHPDMADSRRNKPIWSISVFNVPIMTDPAVIGVGDRFLCRINQQGDSFGGGVYAFKLGLTAESFIFSLKIL